MTITQGNHLNTNIYMPLGPSYYFGPHQAYIQKIIFDFKIQAKPEIQWTAIPLYEEMI